MVLRNVRLVCVIADTGSPQDSHISIYIYIYPDIGRISHKGPRGPTRAQGGSQGPGPRFCLVEFDHIEGPVKGPSRVEIFLNTTRK